MSSALNRLVDGRVEKSGGVQNLPIELLRTLSYVAKLRSHTRAALALGISQPTVSTHIKRLQEILGVDLLDKSVPGVTLTETGEIVVRQTQSVLDLHDEILATCSRKRSGSLVKVGIHNSFAESLLPAAFKRCREQHPNLRFQVESDTSENLIAALQEQVLDIIVAVTVAEPPLPSRHHWSIGLVWASAAGFKLTRDGPIPLVAYSGNSQLTQVAKCVLERGDIAFDIVYSSSDAASLNQAVQSGLGVAVMPRDALAPRFVECASSLLPPLPALVCGIYRRPGQPDQIYDEIADAIAEQINPLESSQRAAAT